MTPVLPALPGFNREHLAPCTPEELLQLLIANEDRVPRELIDECVARGAAMLPLLRAHLDDACHWEEVTDDGHWWALLHGIHILGAMEGETAAHALLDAFQRMDTARDDHLWGWLYGYWPALMRNKFTHVCDHLREIAADRRFDEFMRSEAADCVTAAAQQEGMQTLETALDWVATLAGEDAEEKVFRYLAGNLLLDFPRPRHRPLLERLAHMQHADGPFGRHFDENDIECAFARGDDPPWNRFANPWRFYDPVAIAARQERWAEEDAETLLDDAPPQPVTRSSPKIGRNDPCPCGSGRKYKKCCLPAGEAQHARVAGS